jgi:transposase
MGEAAVFKSGRHFCAWLGLVPQQHGSGGKVRLGGISKRGDRYVRTLLVGGARSVMFHLKDEESWLGQLKARKHANVAVVAQAAKTARTIWALVAKEQPYQAGHQCVRPVMA